MQRWVKTAMVPLSDEQKDIFFDIYKATFDATLNQLKALLAEVEEIDPEGWPLESLEALKKVIRISIADPGRR